MSIVKKNLVTKGMSGKIGGMLVFRKVGNQTIVSTVPVKSERAPSASQLTQQERFQRAVMYAKAVLADPVRKAMYEAVAKSRELVTAYNVAVADYLHAPVIMSMDVTAYTGAAGEQIRLQAGDDFKVNSVLVELFDSSNALSESGPALQVGSDWVYTTTKALGALNGCKLVAKVKDLPGNETKGEHVF